MRFSVGRFLAAFLNLPQKDVLAEVLSKTLRDPQNAPEFFRTLLNQKLHAFLFNDRLVQFKDDAGHPFTPVFSRAGLMPAPPFEDALPVEIQGREMLEKTRGTGRVVLNPGCKEFKAFGQEDIERILDKLVTSRFKV